MKSSSTQESNIKKKKKQIQAIRTIICYQENDRKVKFYLLEKIQNQVFFNPNCNSNLCIYCFSLEIYVNIHNLR
jgi:hypothetical protein